jgi:hypothetical protein
MHVQASTKAGRQAFYDRIANHSGHGRAADRDHPAALTVPDMRRT